MTKQESRDVAMVGFLLRAPRGDLTAWKRAASKQGISIAEWLRRAAAEAMKGERR